jgi:hypothetical protein
MMISTLFVLLSFISSWADKNTRNPATSVLVSGVNFSIDASMVAGEKIKLALEKIVSVPSGKELFSHLKQKVTIQTTSAFATKIHVAGNAFIEVNESYLDSTNPQILASTLAHELEHIRQQTLLKSSGSRTPDGLVAEASALSRELQVAFELAKSESLELLINLESPEATRLLAYFGFPTATLQAWVGSKYSWARTEVSNFSEWDAQSLSYWRAVQAQEKKWRSTQKLKLSSKNLGLPAKAVHKFIEDISKAGDNWLEEGMGGSYQAASGKRELVMFLEKLGQCRQDEVVKVPLGMTKSEEFLLRWSFLGKYDPISSSFTVKFGSFRKAF